MGSPIPKDLLKTYRLKMKMTQKLTAQVAGVSEATYRRWEQGHSFPRELEKRRDIMHLL